MSKERILETIGQVKDKFIEEAAPKGLLDKEILKENQMKKVFGKAKIYQVVKWGAMAACLCLLVGLGMKMNLFSATKDEASFEMKDAAMNQSAKTESVMEESTLGFDSGMSKADSDFAGSATGADSVIPSTESSVTEERFPDWGIILSVKNVTSTGLTLVVAQDGGNPTGELQTGEPYRLLAFEEGTWKNVEELPLPEGVDSRGWNSIAYFLPKGETKEFNINWEWIFGELPSGTYRLMKEFMDFRETANYDTFEYWVEFTIQ